MGGYSTGLGPLTVDALGLGTGNITFGDQGQHLPTPSPMTPRPTLTVSVPAFDRAAPVDWFHWFEADVLEQGGQLESMAVVAIS